MDAVQKVEIVKMVSQVDWIAIITNVVIAFMGIAGTFGAAIYGGKKTMESVKEQYNLMIQDEMSKDKKRKDEILMYISKFLKNEMEYNYNVLCKWKLFDYIDEGYGTQFGFPEKKEEKLMLETYDKMKFELIKYAGNAIINEIIYIYDCLDLLFTFRDLKELDEAKFEKLKNFKGTYSWVLEQLK